MNYWENTTIKSQSNNKKNNIRKNKKEKQLDEFLLLTSNY